MASAQIEPTTSATFTCPDQLSWTYEDSITDYLVDIWVYNNINGAFITDYTFQYTTGIASDNITLPTPVPSEIRVEFFRFQSDLVAVHTLPINCAIDEFSPHLISFFILIGNGGIEPTSL